MVLDGDTARPEIWADLSTFLRETWPHASGVRMALARLAIDSGDGATTDGVYAWARSAGPGQVVPVKGMAGFDRSTPVDGPTFVIVRATTYPLVPSTCATINKDTARRKEATDERRRIDL